jgi:hypothetical protein
MRFIDYIHLISARNRSVLGVFFKLPNFFNAVVGSGVYFDNVNIPRLGKLLANLAFMAGRTVDGVQAIDRLGENLGAACLARSPRSRKQIRMTYAVVFDLVAQSSYDVILPYDLVKAVRTEFSV